MSAPTSAVMNRRRRQRALGALVSLTLHTAIVVALIWPWASAPLPQEPPAVTVSLVPGPPAAKPAAPKPAPAHEKKPPPRPQTARPPVRPTDVEPVPAGKAKAVDQ